MFHNPFNSKVVADITKFLNEHRNDVRINPCLDEAAKEAAGGIDLDGMLIEEKRAVLRLAFNEAVGKCGCKGTNQEANEFTAAFERHVEEGKKLPPEFLKNIEKKKKEAKAKKESVEEGDHRRPFDRLDEAYALEGFAQPTEKELKASVKWLQSILKDPRKLKDSGLSKEDAEDNLAAALDMLEFGKKYASKVKESFDVTEAAKKQSFSDLLMKKATRKKEPWEEAYYKWFDGVSIGIFDMGKVAKEIQALIAAKANLDVEMPKLVKKYGKNN